MNAYKLTSPGQSIISERSSPGVAALSHHQDCLQNACRCKPYKYKETNDVIEKVKDETKKLYERGLLLN